MTYVLTFVAGMIWGAIALFAYGWAIGLRYLGPMVKR